MGKIVLLDELTINQIAAGEVIERPASVVKEMLENSIDAGAKNIIVEIKNGGISYIRISDDGKGIARDDVELAFERHATSKIRSADDLQMVKSMGFRGEALASIAAIANVELVSRTDEEQVGTKIVVEGGNVLSLEDTGCSRGTTITVRNLFYNTPVRYKFLKKDFTETGYIEDIVSRIALVHPEIAIKLINTGKTIIQTNGNGDLKTVIYSLYGKEIADEIIPVEYEYEYIKVKGVIGKPAIARSNRSNQIFFVNDRYVKDKTLTAAAEQAYKGMIPLGKYAFLVLNVQMAPSKVDVNVHPAKLEVRFAEESMVFQAVYHSIKDILKEADLVSDREKNKEAKEASKDAFKIDYLNLNNNNNGGLFGKKTYSELADIKKEEIKQTENAVENDNAQMAQNENISNPNTEIKEENVQNENQSNEKNIQNVEKNEKTENVDSKEMVEQETKKLNIAELMPEKVLGNSNIPAQEQNSNNEPKGRFDGLNVFERLSKLKNDLQKEGEMPKTEEEYKKQMEYYRNIAKEADEIGGKSFDEMYEKLFGKAPIDEEKKAKEAEEKEKENLYKITDEDLSDNVSVFEEIEEYKKPTYKFIGIAFSTYIILEMDKELYIMDQHAAHERILYEKVKKNFYSSNNKDSQLLLLPDIIKLTNKEMLLAKDNFDLFEKAGFMVEEFGENTIKLSGVPEVCMDLDTKDLFLETLDEIDTVARTAKQEKEEKFIATVACKAAVKANMALTEEEVASLMDQLLKLPNPFSCPHGRPTVIKMSKYDIERKFARK